MQTIKCAWCGATVPLTGNGKRPKQHRNGSITCVGSGQPAETHAQVHTTHPDSLKPQPKK